MSRSMLRGDYDNRATFLLPTQTDQTRYRDVGFPLPTVTLPNARRGMGDHRHMIYTGGAIGMGCAGCPGRGMAGLLVPATWQSPRFMLSGLRGAYNSDPSVLSSLTPIVTQTETAVKSGGNWISENPGKSLIGAALVGYLLLRRKNKLLF